MRAFLYSKRQEQLAGRDGEEEFNRVFGADARVVVILYRKAWGTTPWTRIEQTAVKNRADEQGYDFTLFIPLDSAPSVPDWIPRTRLWYGLERGGVDGAASVIMQLIEKRGGEARAETVEDKLARVARERAAEKARENLFHSDEGVRRATEEAGRFFAEIERVVRTSKANGLQFDVASEPQGRAVYLDGFSVSCVWITDMNSLVRARIMVVLWRGNVDFGGRYYLDSSDIEKRKFHPDFSPAGQVVWREGPGGKPLSTAEFVELCVMSLVERAQLENARRR